MEKFQIPLPHQLHLIFLDITLQLLPPSHPLDVEHDSQHLQLCDLKQVS